MQYSNTPGTHRDQRNPFRTDWVKVLFILLGGGLVLAFAVYTVLLVLGYVS